MSQYYNLAPEVPQKARDLYENRPNTSEQYSTVSAKAQGYDNRNGDLSTLIQQAAANNQIVDLEDGTYEMSSTVTVTAGVAGVVGHGSTSARIYYTGTHLEYLFDVAGASDMVLEGVTFDISEDTPEGLKSDVGVLRSNVAGEGWFHDVRLFGRRHRWQDIDDTGTLSTVGGRFTFKVEAAAGATNLINECHFPDGGTNVAHITGSTTGHAIGPNADPGHEGYNVWRKTSCSQFQDNGFYVSNSPGPNIMWNCRATNNSASQFRLSDNDHIIGGYSEVSALPTGRLGTLLEVDGGSNVRVVGLEMNAVADYGNEAIQIRSAASEVFLDRLSLHSSGEPPARPVRLSSANATPAQITINDCYWYDQSTGTNSMVFVRNADVMADSSWRVYSENRNEFQVEPDATITIGTTTYGPGAYTQNDLGLEHPLPLPTFGFGPEPTEEFGGEAYTTTEMPQNINTNSELVENNEAFQAVDVGQAVQSLRGYAIADGCEPSKSAQMTISTAPGVFYVAGNRFTDTTSQSVQLDAGAVEPRKDLLYFNTEGVLTFRKGVPAPPEGPPDSTYSTAPFDFWQPSPPDHTEIDGTPIAEVSVAAGATDINELRDLRSRRTFSDLVGFRVSADKQLLVPKYDSTLDAPGVERSLVIISGAGTEPAGIYRHTGSGYTRVAGAGALSDLNINATKNWNGFGIANVGNFDAQSVSTPNLRVTEGRGLIGSIGRHTEYGLTATPEEIARYTLEADEKLQINRLEVKMKGGGTNPGFTVQIFDATAGTVIASTSTRLVAGAQPIGESVAGATILVRYTNETEGAQSASISVVDTIVPA